MIGTTCPVRTCTLSLSAQNRAHSPATSPLRTVCFDIFSPPPGDSDVISQVDRLSSNETKIAPRSVRIAVGASVSDNLHGRLQSGWVSNLTLPERRSLSTPHGISSRRPRGRPHGREDRRRGRRR